MEEDNPIWCSTSKSRGLGQRPAQMCAPLPQKNGSASNSAHGTGEATTKRGKVKFWLNRNGISEGLNTDFLNQPYFQ